MQGKSFARLGLFSAALLVPLGVAAQQVLPSNPPSGPYGYRPGPGHMMWNAGHAWHGGGMFLVMLLVLLLVLVAAFVLARLLPRGPGARRGPDREDPASSALRILNERFARGEIARPEFEEMRAVLLSDHRR